MKIDSIDIRSFDAKQLTVDFEPPQTGVTVEMFDGALIPSESETYTPLVRTDSDSPVQRKRQRRGSKTCQ